jgi:hypothetical protein
MLYIIYFHTWLLVDTLFVSDLILDWLVARVVSPLKRAAWFESLLDFNLMKT